MKKEEKVWWKILLFPHWFIKIILVILSTILLIYSLGFKDANQVIAYISYALSAYTLVVVCIKVPAYTKQIKHRVHENKYYKTYLSKPNQRATVSLYASSGVNIIYALFYFGTGIYFESVWTMAIAVYYIVLSLIRYGLVRKDRRKMLIEDETERRNYELKSCHFCGCLMFLLNIAVTGLVIQMIWQNKHYNYPGFLIYAQAAYTFFCLTMAIINMIKYRKMERPILSAAKVVSMSCALTSILALQTAMLIQFGSEQINYIRVMNCLTGSVVCLSVFGMAVWLVHKTRKELAQIDSR